MGALRKTTGIDLTGDNTLIGDIYDGAEKVVQKVGNTVEAIVSDPKKLVAVAIMVAYPGAAQALGDFILGEALAVDAMVASGAMTAAEASLIGASTLSSGSAVAAIVGQTALNTAFNGGDFEAAVKGALIQQGLPAVMKSDVMTSLNKDMVNVLGKYGAEATTQAGLAAIMGKDPVAAFVFSGAQAATDLIMKQAGAGDILKDIPPSAQNAVRASITASLTGKDAAAAAANSLVSSAIKGAQTAISAAAKTGGKTILTGDQIKAIGESPIQPTSGAMLDNTIKYAQLMQEGKVLDDPSTLTYVASLSPSEYANLERYQMSRVPEPVIVPPTSKNQTEVADSTQQLIDAITNPQVTPGGGTQVAEAGNMGNGSVVSDSSTGSVIQDILTGGGSNQLTEQELADIVAGGIGDATLTGGTGQDTLAGGSLGDASDLAGGQDAGTGSNQLTDQELADIVAKGVGDATLAGGNDGTAFIPPAGQVFDPFTLTWRPATAADTTTGGQDSVAGGEATTQGGASTDTITGGANTGTTLAGDDGSTLTIKPDGTITSTESTLTGGSGASDIITGGTTTQPNKEYFADGTYKVTYEDGTSAIFNADGTPYSTVDNTGTNNLSIILDDSSPSGYRDSLGQPVNQDGTPYVAPAGNDTLTGGQSTVTGGQSTSTGGQSTVPGGQSTVPGGQSTVPGGGSGGLNLGALMALLGAGQGQQAPTAPPVVDIGEQLDLEEALQTSPFAKKKTQTKMASGGSIDDLLALLQQRG